MPDLVLPLKTGREENPPKRNTVDLTFMNYLLGSLILKIVIFIDVFLFSAMMIFALS